MSILPSRLRTLAVVLPLGACFSWRREPAASPEPDRFVGGPVRVTRVGGPPIVLTGVTIGRDSLFGNEHAKPHRRVAIPVSEVRMLEEPRVNPLATVGLVVLTVTAAVAVVAAFFTHTVAIVD